MKPMSRGEALMIVTSDMKMENDSSSDGSSLFSDEGLVSDATDDARLLDPDPDVNVAGDALLQDPDPDDTGNSRLQSLDPDVTGNTRLQSLDPDVIGNTRLQDPDLDVTGNTRLQSLDPTVADEARLQNPDPNVTRNAHLHAGARFVIKDADGLRFLTVEGQDLVLQDCGSVDHVETYWHWHWDSFEDKGWLHLRNRVTGGYIGVTCHGGSGASVKVRPGDEDHFSKRLVATSSAGQGHTLSVLSPRGGLWQITLGDPSYEAMVLKSGGTSFEFIKVEE
ncbi:hypothetical protein E4U42_001061 [Claviceps africana]|uniref:Uncharacterized protein n=1 Tax=Claviceps africana TaxID=83212 RepID=A0A8K0JIV3_9HYPO|nr:hypothetical protein E4U42_001061 [Claviceps africana]